MNTNKSQAPQLPQTDVKCRFFAQYWGQLYEFKNTKSKWRVNEGCFPLESGDNERLILTDLKNITDEDALTAIRIVKVYVRKDGAYVTEHVPIENIKKSFLDVPIWRLDLADFLRSKGYALPFMEYSVEDLVLFDWVRLV